MSGFEWEDSSPGGFADDMAALESAMGQHERLSIADEPAPTGPPLMPQDLEWT